MLYGTGMRLSEALRLLVKDVDFARIVVMARQTKGNEDRDVLLRAAVASRRELPA
jgi:site-specific recombinase XerD